MFCYSTRYQCFKEGYLAFSLSVCVTSVRKLVYIIFFYLGVCVCVCTVRTLSRCVCVCMLSLLRTVLLTLAYATLDWCHKMLFRNTKVKLPFDAFQKCTNVLRKSNFWMHFSSRKAWRLKRWGESYEANVCNAVDLNCMSETCSWNECKVFGIWKTVSGVSFVFSLQNDTLTTFCW